MKKDLRMNAKSPDPDDLAGDDLPESEARKAQHGQRREVDESGTDRSAPHVPPVEKGRIRGE